MNSEICVNGKLITPQTNIEKKWTKEELCVALMKLEKQRHMVSKISSKFKNHKIFGSDFDYEEISGLNYITISNVLEAWVAYKSKKKNSKVKIGKSIRLSTFGELTGYYINAFQNNVNKQYVKQMTEKRSSAKSLAYFDDISEENDKNSLESYWSHDPQKKFEFDQAMNHIASELSKYDELENIKMQAEYGKSVVPMKNQSHLAPLFKALCDSKYKGNIDEIRKDLKWTDHLFKRNREILFTKLKKDFKDIGPELLSFAIESNSDQYGEVKEKRNRKQEKKKVLEVRKTFEMKSDKKSNIYSFNISLVEQQGREWKTLLKKVKKLKTKENLNFDEAKKQLIEEAKPLEEAVMKKYHKLREIA